MSQVGKKICDCSFCRRFKVLLDPNQINEIENADKYASNEKYEENKGQEIYEGGQYIFKPDQIENKDQSIYQRGEFNYKPFLISNDNNFQSNDNNFQSNDNNFQSNYNNFQSNEEQQQQYKPQQNQGHIIDNDLQETIDWINQFPNLRNVKNQKQVMHSFMAEFVTQYQTCDQSLQDISFHFKPDGSQAILFSMFCRYEILQKTVAKRNDIVKLYYDSEGCSVLLVIDPKIDYQNYDQMHQEFKSNPIPLEVFISSKFEKQQKIFQEIGLAAKSQVKKFPLIKNPRLRIDLGELFECLDDQLDFDYKKCSDHCFAYYTQSENLNQLEGLIIGPQDTPYEGLPYTVTITIPEQYPIEPPKVIFNQQILHPNISEEGEICLNILQDKWNSVLTIQKVLVSIVSLLYEKNLDDVYNHYAKTLYQEDPEEYRRLIRKQSILQNAENLQIDFKSLESAKSKEQNEYGYDGYDYGEDNYDSSSDCYGEDDNQNKYETDM
ncbi:hypothetical protein ABPG74_018636 [Tetrahymena malaccensis]